MLTKLNKRLEDLAYRLTSPFCYQCYQVAPTGRCSSCYSDDLMRFLSDVGVEWGVDWVIKHLLQEQIGPINIDEEFEESMVDYYPETTTIGFLKVNTIIVMKELDSVAWKLAIDEWIDGLTTDEEIITFDNGTNYYRVSEIEAFLEEQEDRLKEEKETLSS